MNMGTDSWRSVDGEWVVQRLPGWIRDGRAGADFYQVKRLGRLVAELDRFEAVAEYVAIDRLVADPARSTAIPGQRSDPYDPSRLGPR
jgi:hypothetical protein